MQKEVIYLDNEDDITTIIGKLKSAKPRIVALVPPKRVGVLQSAVNLRLLSRTAEQNQKRLVIITNNSALATLSASAKIPVAKNLQSKPEIAPIAALEIDEGDDVIDGINLPIGDHAAQVDTKEVEIDQAVGEIAVKESNEKTKLSKTKKKTVPNFNSFRKKFALITVALVALIGFLVWALVYAPHATIAVTMRTSDITINQLVGLSEKSDSSVEKTTLKVEAVTTEQETSVDFEATGEKNVGEKGTSTVQFSQDSPSSVTVPEGTELTSTSGKTFLTNDSVTVPRSKSFTEPGCNSFPTCPGTITVGVTASNPGEAYNGQSGSMSGAPNGLSAVLQSTTSGGTDKVATVVTEKDIDKAKKAAEEKIDQKAAEKKIIDSLSEEQVLISNSLQTDSSGLKSSLKKDEVAKSGEATYGGTVKFKAYVVNKSELKDYLQKLLEQQLDNPASQRVYDSGEKEIKFTNFRKDSNNLSATISTVGKIGPKIDETEVEKKAIGKKAGEVQQELSSISGVSDVDVRLSPFWVTSVPGSADKITVEFKVDE